MGDNNSVELVADISGDLFGALQLIAGESDSAHHRVSAATVSSANSADVTIERMASPGVEADAYFSAVLQSRHHDGIHRVGVQGVGDEFADGLKQSIGEVDEYHASTDLGATFTRSTKCSCFLPRGR